MNSEKAEELVKDMFLDIDESYSIFYYPNYTSIIQLLNDGLSLSLIKKHIYQFNQSVKCIFRPELVESQITN